MKSLQGVVRSTPDASTAYVTVEWMTEHPKYKKRIRRSKVFVADNIIGAAIDNEVLMVETRPMSKRKTWKIEKVVKG